ncbi:FAD-binding oxidoreductase [Nisaea acidiphila]|uniref:FAD-binding oxidoreductase n=1 Tax=Nisaea acidiphila TaxID=1862145 RepID=A0A9J7AQ87_9PROT|nr:FAD-binding oxidoreductase [Nisaea acidiphila]UUX49771.1 FAD-binding oxidoreductase [Nisaea acidiphila]
MTDTIQCADFLIIGAGMAGASCAYFLAPHGSVILLEREEQPGYHTTGRSAALYIESYGNAAIRALNRAGKPFFQNPPEGFADGPILTPRGSLTIAEASQLDALDAAHNELAATAKGLEIVEGARLLELFPALDPEKIVRGLYDPNDMDMDVHALHWGFIRGMRDRGGKLVTDADVQGLTHGSDGWKVETRAGTFASPVVINAAGAWADEIGKLAGAKPIGLVPKRRTAFTFDPPEGLDPDKLPAVVNVNEDWYVKPEAGRFLGSPADETPSMPTDAQPEDLDLAIAVDRIETATTLKVGRFHSRWAGLRSFVSDKSPVVGFEPGLDGFFWLAGQGGYGIQTSAGLGMTSAALARGAALPDEVVREGLSAADLAPDRPTLAAAEYFAG